jgi:hypothetical protein
MATVNICGFETGDATELVSLTGTASIQSSVVRTGGYALRSNPTGSGGGSGTLWGLDASGLPVVHSLTTYYMRFYFRYAIKPAAGNEMIAAIDGDSSAKFQSALLLRLNSDGTLAAYRSRGNYLTAGLLGTGSAVLSQDTWYRIEMMRSSTAHAPWEVRVNGVTDISGSDGPSVITSGAFTLGKAGNANSQTVDFFYDDVVISNSGFPGAGAVIALHPDGTIADDWSIGAGSGSDYQQIDETTPDGDTTYLVASVVGSTGTFTLTDTGIDPASVINTCKLLGGFKTGSGSPAVNMFLSTALGHNCDPTGDYSTTGSYVVLGQVNDTGPAVDGSPAWTPADLDGCFANIQFSSGVGSVPRCTYLAVMVDYGPPPQPPVRTILGVL